MPIWEFEGKKPRIDPTVFVAPTATIIGDVEIAAESSVFPSAVIRGDYNPVRIGTKCNVQDSVSMHSTPAGPVVVGDSVSIGHNAIVHRCTVGSNVIVGMGSILLDGSKIEDWVIVGAGALVTSDTVIPSKSLALGVPAKVVKQLDEAGLAQIRANAEGYFQLSRRYLSQMEKFR
jgi:carbonic anhydrase/acetyltransferase-like protein (isoleucine patch superfamily)